MDRFLKFWYSFVHIFDIVINNYSLRLKYMSHISGVIVSVLASSVVDHGFEPQSGQTKDNKIGSCFFPKHTALMSWNC